MKTKLPGYLVNQFSTDKRKRRRQHRQAARRLIANGTLFNARALPGSSPSVVAWWHLQQARYLGR
jgi:hypothetical protein